jgi:hypothetical protein
MRVNCVSVCRDGVLALSLAMLLVLSMACSIFKGDEITKPQVPQPIVQGKVEERKEFPSLIHTGKDEKIYWKGEESYPYQLTMLEWKKEFEVEGEYGPVKNSSIVKYPSISGMKDPKLEQKINKLIHDDMLTMTERFFSDSIYDTHNWRECYIMLLTEDYLSICYDGGVHSNRTNRFSQVLNIDLKKGKKLEVSDFFTSKTKAVDLIMEHCKADLKRQYEEYYGDPIGEMFSMMIESDVNPKTCSVVSLTQTGFYLIFDDVFSKAEGRWVVHAPYEAFGNECKLSAFEGAYGFFSVPEGWSYSYNPSYGFMIKFPVLMDEEERITNLNMLNDSDVKIELPISLPDELVPGVKNPYTTTWMLIQRNHVNLAHGEIDDYYKENIVTMDGYQFMQERGYGHDRVLHPDPSKSKLVQRWKFHELNQRFTISFYIEYEFYSDFLVRLPHQEALNEMDQQIYFQINEVLRTFQIK